MSIVGLVATIWGFAEATVFFIIPDVYLSAVALRSTRAGLLACLYATVGAIFGGAVMYAWSTGDLAEAEAVLEAIPAIDDEMIAGVRAKLTNRGLPAVVLGFLSGTPYKIFAVESARLDLGAAGFLLVSVPARLIRFFVVTLLSAWLSHRIFAAWPLATKGLLHAACWTAVYIAYFYMHPF